MAAKTCQICGKGSGIYPLCLEHLELKNQGKVVKNSEGKWVLFVEESASDSNCIICSEPSKGKSLCIDCYKESIDRKDEFDKNQKPFELKDYYFNLRSNIYRIANFDYVKNNSKKLFALAYLVNEIHKDSSLLSRVNDDVKDIIEKKTPQKDIKLTQYTETSDSQKSSIIRTIDGHIVKSIGEQIIDDILYNNQLCHCYDKDVHEISSDLRTLKADWFIPIHGNKGIYIEYWGMDTDDYKKNKDEKKKLYKDAGVSLIQIEKDDTKDVSSLTNRIMREHKTLKTEILNKFIQS
jgi:hypothetical protein